MLFILLSCVGCDQATKFIVKDYLASAERISFWGDIVRFEYTENRGAFLSLGSSLPEEWRSLLFIMGVGLLLLALLTYLFFLAGRAQLLSIVAFSLVCGGGLSNLLDRVAYRGSVIDFLNIGFGSLRTGIFNVADVAITVGVLLLFVSGLVSHSGHAASNSLERSDL
jgi:signal peptidase II